MTDAELRDRLDNVTERLIGAFEELDFVHSLAEALANPQGLEDLDAYLLSETAEILSADGGWMLRPGEGGAFTVTVAQGFPRSTAEGLAPLALSLAGSGQLPYLADDLQRELARGVGGEIPVATGKGGGDLLIPRAFAAAPLKIHGELLAILCLGKREPGRGFSSGEMRLLGTLSSQAALFIKNADLMNTFKTEARTLGRRLQRLERHRGTQPELSWIKGRSRSMRHLARQVEGAATTDATVLLLGESGTGKSLVSRILHRSSPRRGAPFVEINCGAVPAALIESELFGHARGAFTGADRDRPGLFEEAHTGSILLDEVAELPLEAQVKLLTVLEQHRIRRVGENRDRDVDVRVIAATNADLEAAVSGGKFREDLFYRLNVITLRVPPLRDRREDVLPMARRFLEELARETHRQARTFSRDAENALLAYSWPGNVRELRNVIERSLLLCESEVIEAGDLPLEGRSPGILTSGVTRAEPGPLRQALERHERDLLEAALHEAGGVVSDAAELLAISRTNFHNKLRKHGLVRKSSWSDVSHAE